MRKSIAWMMLASALVFGGYRVWDRNTVPPVPVVIEQPVALPPVVQAPEPVPAPESAPIKPSRKKHGAKARHRQRNAQDPVLAPTTSASLAPHPAARDPPAALPVSCATIRWYAANAPAEGKALAATYHPTAAQIAAVKACLRGG